MPYSMRITHKIRVYKNEDKSSVLNLIRLNTPLYFDIEEETDLSNYLKHEIERYFVVEVNDQIIGCGGFNFDKTSSIYKIAWDIIHPNFQSKGIGKSLLEYRLNEIRLLNTNHPIVVRTSQKVFPFYEKNGFQLDYVKEDYWAKGLDLYYMIYRS
jgi:[ribosomal protein S18]-alanine N-acetyltransferase